MLLWEREGKNPAARPGAVVQSVEVQGQWAAVLLIADCHAEEGHRRRHEGGARDGSQRTRRQQGEEAGNQGKERAKDHDGGQSVRPPGGGFETFLARANGSKASGFIAERLKMGSASYLSALLASVNSKL